MQKAVEAEQIVDREVEAFRRRLVAQDAVPTIVELQQRLEDIRAAELEKCLRKTGPMTPEQRAAIEQLSTQTGEQDPSLPDPAAERSRGAGRARDAAQDDPEDFRTAMSRSFASVRAAASSRSGRPTKSRNASPSRATGRRS